MSGPAGGALCQAGRSPNPPPIPRRLSEDPHPPLDLTVELVSLQKSTRGGVASLLVKVGADVPIDGAVVSATVPGSLVFADGSATRTWNVDLTPPGTQTIPVEVIASKDGVFVVSFEVEGTARGQRLHRGVSHRLLIGVHEKAPRVKGGANEYPAVQGEGA